MNVVGLDHVLGLGFDVDGVGHHVEHKGKPDIAEIVELLPLGPVSF